MSEATLALNIVLRDSASSGLNMFGLSLMNLTPIVSKLADLSMMRLTPGLYGMGVTAIVAGEAFGGLSSFVGDTVHAAADLESEMAKVTNSVNGASEASDQMRTTLVTVADSSIYSTSQVADAFAQIGIDGWNAQQIMDGMGQSAVTLAEALNTQTTPAANLLATSMELYRADAADAAQYTNDLTFMFYNGQKTVENVQQAISMVGATAHQLKIPFGELSDVLALLGQDGYKGSQGAASLNYYLTALASPIPKAQKELAALGLLVVNQTSPAFEQFRMELVASGAAGAKVANEYDGTVLSLQNMFTAAQKLGVLHTDQSFMAWATSTGILSSKLYDAQGNFIGLTNSIQLLGEAMKNMNPEQQAIAIQNLFNVRSGRAARDFITNFIDQLNRLQQLDAIRQQTEAAAKAGVNLNTLNNVVARLGTTWTDTMARLGQADLGPLKGVGNALADMLHTFNVAPDSVHTTATVVLLATTAFVGLAAAVSTVAFAGTLLAPVLVAAVPVILALVGMFAQVGAAAGVIAWAFGQAQQKGSQFGAVVRPVFDAVRWAFTTIRDEVVGQLLPALGKLGLNLDTLKVIGIVLLALFVTPIILSLGLLVGTVLVVVAVVTKLVQAVVWVRDVMGQAEQTVAKFILTLGTSVVNGVRLVESTFRSAFNAVASLFPWLYQHNYYVQALVDFIHEKITQAQVVFQAARTVITTAWTELWANTVGRAEAAWSVLVGLFNAGKNRVLSPINQLKNEVMAVFKGMETLLLDAGRNLINMLIQGITSKLADLRNTVGNVASTIAKFLGFHSPTEEGPGRTADTWAPALMTMFASGITSHTPLVQRAVAGVATVLNPGNPVYLRGVVSGASSSSGRSGETHIHVHAGGREIARVVLDELTGTLKQNGAGRLFR